ncbi:[histone H3]-lysine(4) N-trimethyltransferase [Ranunculus cassubicifolius]
MKRSVTEKSSGRVIIQALTAAPNCLWRGGNRTVKPSISHSQYVRKFGAKKCDSRLHTRDAKNHNIQIGAARAKVKRALSLFRTVFKSLLQDNEGNSANLTGKKIKRFDLTSATILKKSNYWVNSGKQILGSVPGVEVGDEYHYRVELAIIGLHRHYESGIDYVNEDGQILAASIVASGVYADYMYNSDVLVYCGQGGNPQRERDNKIAIDQKLERGNLALKNSMIAERPVRVIRGFNDAKGHETLLARLETDATLVYDGLYMVKSFWEEQGAHGNIVLKYQLTRIPGQPAIKWFKKTNRENFL